MSVGIQKSRALSGLRTATRPTPGLDISFKGLSGLIKGRGITVIEGQGRLTAADIRDPARFLSALRRTFLAAGAPAPPESAWQGAAGKALQRPVARAPRRSASPIVR